MRSLADSEFDRLVRDFPALQSRASEGIDFVNFNCEIVESCCGSSYVIPFVSETECLVTLRENCRWVLPGGTLEPEENWLQAAHREIMEETGAALDNVRPIGMYHCVSQKSRPRLPHFPHPIHVRVVSCADADQVGDPSDSDGNGSIIKVQTIAYNEAAGIFSSNDQDFAALYELAFICRKYWTSLEA